MNRSRFVRQVPRPLSIIFTATVITNIIVVATGQPPKIERASRSIDKASTWPRPHLP